MENINTKELLITLVNEDDEIIGYDEKLKVHREGALHRAFSILIFNSRNEMLIHQRAFEKYHSAGLWTNACCGHPNKGETLADAAYRRLGEEMGFQCTLRHQFSFHYRVEFQNGLIENEIDHVFYGQHDSAFVCNPNEVADFRWEPVEKIEADIRDNPEWFTIWFKEIMSKLAKDAE